MWNLSQSGSWFQCSWMFWLTRLIKTEFFSGISLNLSVIPFSTFLSNFFQDFNVERQNSFFPSVNVRLYRSLGKRSRFSCGRSSVKSFSQKELEVKVLFIQLRLSPAQCSFTLGTPSPPRCLGKKMFSFVVLYDPACINLQMILSISSIIFLGGSGMIAAMWLNLLKP